MDTIEPASITPELLEQDDAAEPVQVVPPVVAVLVTHDPGPALESALAALSEQDYTALSVLVLDNGSSEDPTPRIAATMPKAFVRRRAAGDADLGFAAGANDALASVEGAMFLLFCHDDVAPDADAVRLLVEEAYRSNAAVVGPKFVDAEHPDVLLDVGMTIDHYGVPFSVVEPDEVDQEQHDAVRDVFFVSHALMLVRADLFHELGGFDTETFPGADDIDLCWRARLAGARVVVAPTARVRHRPAAIEEHRTRGPRQPDAIRAQTRARARMLYKAYSGRALIWVLPVAFTLLLAEALGLLVTGRWRRATALLSGWLSAFSHPSELRRARAETQHLRRVDDIDVRDLMIRGSARVRTFMTRRLHAGERIAEVSARTRLRVEEARSHASRLPVTLAAVMSVLVLIGIRGLLFGRVPEVGAFRAWPGVGDSWATFAGSWRTTFMGAPVSATPVFGFMATMSAALLGHNGMARSLVVGGALPVGMWGTYRLVRPFAPTSLPAVVAAVIYGANPIARNAIWRGELGPLVCFALVPFLFGVVIRASESELASRARLHAFLAGGLLLAVMAAAWPPALLLAGLIALAYVGALPFLRDGEAARRAAIVAAGASAVAVVLCTPWIWSLVGADAPTLGFQPRPPLSLASVLSFHTGRAGAGLAAWGIIAAAAVPLAIATGSRLVWATRAWVLAAVSFALAWLPGRIWAHGNVPSPNGVLVPAALGLAFAAGIGVAAILDDLPRFHFGWRHVMTIVAIVGTVFALLGFAGDVWSGRFGLAGTDWVTQFSWMSDTPAPGGFRVLWIGDPNVLPADAKVTDGIGFATTRDGTGDARALWAAPEHSADRKIAQAIAAANSGQTARLGHLLAPTGIRYVAFVTRAAPTSGPRGRPLPGLADALVRQLDLTLSRVDNMGTVYANDAWIPMHAHVPSGTGKLPIGDSDRSALERSGAPDVTGVETSHGKTDRLTPGTLLWAEAANGGWHARSNGNGLDRTAAFGWTNAFHVEAAGQVTVHYHGSLFARLLRWLEVLAWVAASIAFILTRRASREAT